ncbi:hypothetical protein ACHAXS_001106 [Conticribra weissflogii]
MSPTPTGRTPPATPTPTVENPTSTLPPCDMGYHCRRHTHNHNTGTTGDNGGGNEREGLCAGADPPRRRLRWHGEGRSAPLAVSAAPSPVGSVSVLVSTEGGLDSASRRGVPAARCARRAGDAEGASAEAGSRWGGQLSSRSGAGVIVICVVLFYC